MGFVGSSRLWYVNIRLDRAYRFNVFVIGLLSVRIDLLVVSLAGKFLLSDYKD